MKNSPSKLIYIVDDDPDDRQIILDAFLENSPDIDYVFIEDAETLLKILTDSEQQLPTIIILDLNMPGTLGLQALREIRAQKQFTHIPIIVLTTSTLSRDKKSSYEFGANCFLRKPDSFNELVDITTAISQLWMR